MNERYAREDQEARELAELAGFGDWRLLQDESGKVWQMLVVARQAVRLRSFAYVSEDEVLTLCSDLHCDRKFRRVALAA